MRFLKGKISERIQLRPPAFSGLRPRVLYFLQGGRGLLQSMGFGAKAKEFQSGILMLRSKEKKIGG